MNAFTKFMTLLGTGFGVGYSKKAPGTFGSLLGLPLGYLIARRNLPFDQIMFVAIVVCIIGFLITAVVERALGTHDDQRIVIDEIAGQMIAIMFVPATVTNLVLGFVLFRLFDIWKPGPIGYIDEHLPGAAGTFFDDILAGIVATGILYAANTYFPETLSL